MVLAELVELRVARTGELNQLAGLASGVAVRQAPRPRLRTSVFITKDSVVVRNRRLNVLHEDANVEAGDLRHGHGMLAPFLGKSAVVVTILARQKPAEALRKSGMEAAPADDLNHSARVARARRSLTSSFLHRR
jgi:hypothetical protein